MDGDLVLIFGFVLIAAAIVLRFATAAHKRSVEHEERKLELLARKAEAEAGHVGGDLNEIRELRERVKVLERITTDDHQPKALSAEIEKLRDQ